MEGHVCKCHQDGEDGGGPMGVCCGHVVLGSACQDAWEVVVRWAPGDLNRRKVSQHSPLDVKDVGCNICLTNKKKKIDNSVGAVYKR